MTASVGLDGDRLIASRHLDAEPALVWEAFTTPEHLAAFWGGHHATVLLDSVVVDLRVGGSFEVETQGVDGSRRLLCFRYEVIDAPRRLVLTESRTGITTEICLQATGSGTTVVIHQRRLPPEHTDRNGTHKTKWGGSETVRRSVGLGIATMGGLASTLLSGTPAYAHFTQIQWNGNQAYVDASHHRIWVYDGNCNGRDAYVTYETNIGSAVDLVDSNGCETGYPSRGPFAAEVVRYRVCEVGGGCSGWKSA